MMTNKIHYIEFVELYERVERNPQYKKDTDFDSDVLCCFLRTV